MEIRRSATLKEQAYQAILDGIVSQKIQRGQIYSEQWFADSFQISRTPVREALLQFRLEGLMEVLPNRGVKVRTFSRQDALNTFQLRAAIEGFCAANLARHHQEPEARLSLRRIGESLERCRSDFSKKDEMFIHEEIIRFCGNPMFREQFDNMRTRIDIFWWNVIEAEHRRDQVYEEHKAILDAMLAGDEAGAVDASYRHSRITLDVLNERFSFEE
jgi:DNA-binding GntR family transcriptional regulator